MERVELSFIKQKLHCLKQGHMRQQIDFICSQSTCQNQQLCCYLCSQQMHKSHKMSSIKIFLSKIITISYISTQALVLSAELDKQFNAINQFIDDNKDQFSDKQLVINSIDQYVENKRSYIVSLLSLSQKLRQLTELSQKKFQESFFAFFQKYNQYLQFNENKTQFKDDFFAKNIHEILLQIQTTNSVLNKLQKQNKINQFNVLNLFPLHFQISKQFRPYFYQFYKAPCMKITANTAQMSTSGSQRVIALQPSLSINKKVKKWKIKIVKLASWIGLGACHIEKLKTANWNFNYSSPNHGSYFISSNGYSWSSYKPEFNSKFQSFSFKTGDIVSIEYNPREKKLKFQKMESNQSYTLQVEQNGDSLHPAVNLTGIGDSVEVVP